MKKTSKLELPGSMSRIGVSKAYIKFVSQQQHQEQNTNQAEQHQQAAATVTADPTVQTSQMQQQFLLATDRKMTAARHICLATDPCFSSCFEENLVVK